MSTSMAGITVFNASTNKVEQELKQIMKNKRYRSVSTQKDATYTIKISVSESKHTTFYTTNLEQTVLSYEFLFGDLSTRMNCDTLVFSVFMSDWVYFRYCKPDGTLQETYAGNPDPYSEEMYKARKDDLFWKQLLSNEQTYKEIFEEYHTFPEESIQLLSEHLGFPFTLAGEYVEESDGYRVLYFVEEPINDIYVEEGEPKLAYLGISLQDNEKRRAFINSRSINFNNIGGPCNGIGVIIGTPSVERCELMVEEIRLSVIYSKDQQGYDYNSKKIYSSFCEKKKLPNGEIVYCATFNDLNLPWGLNVNMAKDLGNKWWNIARNSSIWIEYYAVGDNNLFYDIEISAYPLEYPENGFTNHIWDQYKSKKEYFMKENISENDIDEQTNDDNYQKFFLSNLDK